MFPMSPRHDVGGLVEVARNTLRSEATRKQKVYHSLPTAEASSVATNIPQTGGKVAGVVPARRLDLGPPGAALTSAGAHGWPRPVPRVAGGAGEA